MSLVITLDTEKYVVKDKNVRGGGTVPVFTSRVQRPFVEAIETSGRPDSASVSNRISLDSPNLTKGFGRDRIDSDSARVTSEYRHFFNSEGVDTRWADGARLGLLTVACTSEPSTAFIVAHAHFAGNFHTLWVERNVSGSSQRVLNRIISTTAFSGGGDVEVEDGNDDGIRGFDMKALGTNLFVLVNHETGSGTSQHFYYLESSTDGTSWTVNAAGSMGDANALSASVKSNTYPLDGGIIAPALIAGRVVLATWDEASNIVEISSFAGTPYSTSSSSTKELEITSGGGVKGLEIYQDIDGKVKLWLGTREGLYIIDAGTTGSFTIDDFIRLPAHDDTCRRMVVHQGSLWVPVGANSDQAAPIWRVTVKGDLRDIDVGAGLNAGDGIPRNLLGPIQWLESAGEQLFAIVGGTAASRNSRVLVHNGQGWHDHRINDSTNEKYLWLGYGLNDRIYYNIHDNTNGDSVETIANSTVHPLSNSSIPRVASGFVDYPYVDAGFPFDQGPWLQLKANAQDLSGTDSGEYIAAAYGTGDAGALGARTATSLGNFLSGTRLLDIASGAGVNATTFGARLTLNRDSGTNTETPILKDFSIIVIKEPPEREQWEITIDIDATVALTRRTAENIVSDLETTRALGLLRTFTYGPVTTARYVRVDSMIWRPVMSEASTPGAIQAGANIQRGGEMDLVLSERI